MISTRFAKYGDHLIFESQNEEGVYDEIWNEWAADQSGKPKALDILNRANQAFVDLIRNAGGNNAKRHLLIAGYATNIDASCDPLYKMPNDPQKRCALSIHYYAPADFAIIDKDCDWAKARATWGTDADRQYLAKEMNKLKETYIDKGVPVIMGEYGVATKNKTPEMVRLFLSSVCKAAHDVGVCPMLWDITIEGNKGLWYDRATGKFSDPELLRQLQEAGGVTNTNIATTTNVTTGWVREGTNWTYIRQDGSKATGWLNDGGKWYYLSSNGAMQTGWIKDNSDSWYYLDASGAMLSNTTIDSYTLGSDGRML